MRAANILSTAIYGGRPYFEYQYAVARDSLIPWLSTRIELSGKSLGDFGCHAGGMLDAFRDLAGIERGTGIDLNQRVVEESPFVQDDRFRLEVGDLRTEAAGEAFDLILLHDVLEHVVDPGPVLTGAAARLRERGRLFVSFPPYYSPYGGHQHLARSWARVAPYIHYLPQRVFFRLAAPRPSEYMTQEDSLDDMLSVRETRLTLRRAERLFHAADLVIEAREAFLLRPEYTVRYGLPRISAGVVGQAPFLREILVTGVYYLLARADSRGEASSSSK